MTNIKNIKNEKELKKVFYFLAEVFYDDATEYNEHYYNMADRYREMLEQLKKDKDLLLYIEEDKKIIAALTAKRMNLKKHEITIGVLAVAKSYRGKGYAKKLIKEFEKRCIDKKLYHIYLGATSRACSLYLSLGYEPSLNVQFFDFATIDQVKQANKYNLKIIKEWSCVTSGFVIFEVKDLNMDYINHFNNSVRTAHTMYIFEKDLSPNKK